MERLMLLEDSRQQASKHVQKHNWFLKNGISWTREKLTCGDYQLVGYPNVAVDTKKDIQELLGDIQQKTISKSNVSAAIRNLLTEEQSEKYREELLEIITGTDINRDVDNEITMFCYRNKLPEALIGHLQTLYVNYRGFFHRGLVRAQLRGIKLYILVASDPEMIGHKKDIFNKAVTCVDDLPSWKNPRAFIIKGWTIRDRYGNRKPVFKYPHATKGITLFKTLKTLQAKYGCEFVFCRNKDMGKRVIELLTGEEYKEQK